MVKEAKETPNNETKAAPAGSYESMLNEARTNKRTVSLMPTFIEFKEKGQQVVGKFMAKNEVMGTNNKNYFQYTFDTDRGLVKFHLGNVTDGDAGVLMKIGGVYFIQYGGQELLGGGKRVNKFDIQRIITEEEQRVGGGEDEAF